jgi:hypothetical protein
VVAAVALGSGSRRTGRLARWDLLLLRPLATLLLATLPPELVMHTDRAAAGEHAAAR